jgi:hypothetical protein
MNMSTQVCAICEQQKQLVPSYEGDPSPRFCSNCLWHFINNTRARDLSDADYWIREDIMRRRRKIKYKKIKAERKAGMICAACGGSFSAQRTDAKTCSDRCRQVLRRRGLSQISGPASN